MRVLFTESVIVKNDVREVFEFVSLPENIPIFMPAVVRCKPVVEGEINIGAKLWETRKAFGKEVAAQVEISRFERNKVLAIKSENSGIFGEYVYDFTPHEDKTQLELTAYVNARGLMRLLLPVFTASMKKYYSGQVDRIKKFFEK